MPAGDSQLQPALTVANRHEEHIAILQVGTDVWKFYENHMENVWKFMETYIIASNNPQRQLVNLKQKLAKKSFSNTQLRGNSWSTQVELAHYTD